MSVDAVIVQGASGPIPEGDTRLAQLHLQNGRSYVVFAKGVVHADADLDVTLLLHAFLDSSTSDEVRLVATHREALSPPTTSFDEIVIPHTVHELSAAFMLTMTVSVPDDEDGFFIAELQGRSNLPDRSSSFSGLSMIAFPVDTFVPG